MKEIIKTVVQEVKNEIKSLSENKYRNRNIDYNNILSKLSEDGFVVIENYYNEDICMKLKTLLDTNIEKANWQDEEKSDTRFYFANEIFPDIDGFFKDPFITDIVTGYEKTLNFSGFTLANILSYKPNNLGSGGGWHRDLVKKKQTKAILYLSDVGSESGPFQYIHKSHTLKSLISFQSKYGIKFNQNRFSDELIDSILMENPDLLREFHGNSGTLLIVDTRGIHRGKPINQGTRHALTNYYWFNGPIPKHIKKYKPKKV